MDRRRLLGEARDPLERHGWRKRGQVYERRGSDDVVGRLGINTASRGGRLQLNPVVGVRHEALEARVARLQERDGSPARATVSTTVALLLPDGWRGGYPHWCVDQDQSVDERRAEWDVLAGDVEDFGWPWIAAQPALAEIVERRPRAAFDPWRYPVASWMLGRDDEAVSYLEEMLAGFGSRPYHPGGVTEASYRPYAERLLAEITASPGGPTW